MISGFRREVDENCTLLYYSSYMLPICWQQTTYNNRTRTRMVYDYRRPGLSDRPTHMQRRYAPRLADSLRLRNSQRCVWQVPAFLFSSVDCDSVHTTVFGCLLRLYISLYYKLQHFVSLCPIWQVRWIVEVIKETERDLEMKITIIRTMTMGNRWMYTCKRYFRLRITST